MEEGENILDGLEVMEECGEVSGTLLLDITEIVTALTVARNLDTCRMMPTFQQDGNSSSKRLGRIGRAKSMAKVKDEMMKTRSPQRSDSRRLSRSGDKKGKEKRGFQADGDKRAGLKNDKKFPNPRVQSEDQHLLKF